MERWIKPIIAGVVLLFLLGLVFMGHYGLAVILMAVIIFYALFHNPMQHAHKGMETHTKENPKRKLKKRKK